MKEMQLKRGIIISAFQADCRMMVGYVGGPAPGGEFRAFSLVMLWALLIGLLSLVILWALPIFLLSPVMLWALPIVVLSKAFSLLGCSAMCQLRTLLISPQAESLIHHNLGHRPRSAHRPRSSHIPRSGHIPGSGRPLISVPCPRLSTTCSKPTTSRYACHPGSKHHLLSNHQYSHPAMLWKII